MTVYELQQALDELPADPATYSLTGYHKLDAWVLGAGWEVVYVDERGRVHPGGRFAMEDLACQFLYRQFLETERISTQFGLNR